jgi:hypothetical protein
MINVSLSGVRVTVTGAELDSPSNGFENTNQKDAVTALVVGLNGTALVSSIVGPTDMPAETITSHNNKFSASNAWANGHTTSITCGSVECAKAVASIFRQIDNSGSVDSSSGNYSKHFDAIGIG